MKVRLLELLVCPSCRGSLHLNVLRSNVCDRTSLITIQPCTTCHFRDITGKDSDCNYCVQYEIEEALLTCQCGRMFPVVDTVPVMITDAHQAFLRLLHKYPHLSIPSANLSTKKCHAESATQRRFAFEWKRYPEYLEEEERHVFLEETQIKPELFQNRLTLDAGCGMGRFTRIAAALGAEVVGIDASDSVFRAARITMQFDRAHMVQADIMRLPFRDNGFDIIYSLGVLHHTPDTRAAFSALVKKLKTGGLCSIWVYGTAGRYCNFRTNPLKPERARYLTTELLFRLYWLGVLLRERLSCLLRMLTVRMPYPLLYAACFILALIGALPFIKYLTYSVHPDFKVRVLENFDWLAPPFQHHHTKEEVLAWFCEEGLTPVAILPHGFIPKVGIVGEKRPVIAPRTICR